MSYSIQQAYTEFKALKKDISDVPQATFVDWCDYINKFIYRALLSTDLARFIKTANINVVSGQTTYLISDIAADFRDISSFNEGIFYSDNQSGIPLESKLTITGFGSQQQGYYFNGLNVVFTPEPQENVLYYLRYSPRIITLTNFATEYFTLDGTQNGVELIPAEFNDYVRKALDAQYTMWDEEVGAESYADARFVRALNELLTYIKRTPEVYGLTDWSNSF